MTAVTPEEVLTVHTVLMTLTGKKTWILQSEDERLTRQEEADMIRNLDSLRSIQLRSCVIVWLEPT